MSRAVIIAFFAFSAANIVASGFENEAVETATKPFLLSLLALWVFLTHRHWGLITALLFSLAGDIAIGINFIAGMALFFCAHIAYIITFIKAGARPRPVVIAGYAVFLGIALAWLWQPLGAMAVPMLGYGLALTTTAVLSSALNWRTAIGGALFLISDLLIAVRVAEVADIPAQGAWVMLTYCAAQYLLATGFVQYRVINSRTLST
ncbi:lysoplasmalogenase [Catelliglobosispora koreensis]|uniref:lysoplasmalogenase n=1 Tax=Catelliglobosispora koreensis TaxID=129052 RepID=UPI0007C6801B|nr:lysoplasmalogenase [Catelliglobosispora koreensis]